MLIDWWAASNTRIVMMTMAYYSIVERIIKVHYGFN